MSQLARASRYSLGGNPVELSVRPEHWHWLAPANAIPGTVVSELNVPACTASRFEDFMKPNVLKPEVQPLPASELEPLQADEAAPPTKAADESAAGFDQSIPISQRVVRYGEYDRLQG